MKKLIIFSLFAAILTVHAEEETVKFEDLKTINPEFQKLWTVKDGIITGGDGDDIFQTERGQTGNI